LQELDHVNVIKLKDVFSKKPNVSLVFELCSTDLEVRRDSHLWGTAFNHNPSLQPTQIVIKDKTLTLLEIDAKGFLLQGFLGLEYLHRHWILHRVSLELVCQRTALVIPPLGFPPHRTRTSNPTIS
jgi:cyclin-dependent kinase 7